jgi:transcription elongation GreA/GreB family factor
MSKAFTKEANPARTSDLLPDRPIPAGPNRVTAEGLAQIDEMIARLQQEQEKARDRDDISETARLARDLRYWTARRATAQVVALSTSSDVVEFGSRVTLRQPDGREQTYRIVGSDEANPATGTLSHLSPLARAVLGKAVGDMARLGSRDAEITAIQ